MSIKEGFTWWFFAFRGKEAAMVCCCGVEDAMHIVVLHRGWGTKLGSVRNEGRRPCKRGGDFTS